MSKLGIISDSPPIIVDTFSLLDNKIKSIQEDIDKQNKDIKTEINKLETANSATTDRIEELAKFQLESSNSLIESIQSTSRMLLKLKEETQKKFNIVGSLLLVTLLVSIFALIATLYR